MENTSIWNKRSIYRTSDKYHVTDLYTEDLYHTTAVQALLGLGYPEQEIMGAVKQIVHNRGNTDFNAEDLLLILQERHNGQRFMSATKSQIDTDHPDSKDHIYTDCPPVASLKLPDRETDKIIEENRKLEENKICKICLERKVNIVFLPCGHICSCSSCSPSLRKCAICREFIQNAMKIQVL